MSKKKVLLMGKSGAGKTSMRSIIFANYMARDTMKLSPTLDVEHTHVRFLGNLTLNLWDCGGQYRFYESYFDSQRDTIFRNVEVLIYVFDIDSGDLENDITLFDGILEAMEQGSPDASIFVLIHKMDLVAEEDRDRAFQEVSFYLLPPLPIVLLVLPFEPFLSTYLLKFISDKHSSSPDQPFSRWIVLPRAYGTKRCIVHGRALSIASYPTSRSWRLSWGIFQTFALRMKWCCLSAQPF